MLLVNPVLAFTSQPGALFFSFFYISFGNLSSEPNTLSWVTPVEAELSHRFTVIMIMFPEPLRDCSVWHWSRSFCQYLICIDSWLDYHAECWLHPSSHVDGSFWWQNSIDTLVLTMQNFKTAEVFTFTECISPLPQGTQVLSYKIFLTPLYDGLVNHMLTDPFIKPFATFAWTL